YRWRQGDRTPADGLPLCPRLEDYVARYPRLGPLERLSAELIAEEYRARWRWGDRPSPADYAARFPAQASNLPERLAGIDAELAVEGAKPIRLPSTGPQPAGGTVLAA